MANMGIDPALLRRLQQAGGMDMFAMKRDAAKKLQDAEKSGRPVPPELDFSVQEECIACRNDITPPQKPLRCGQCRAIIFCSAECSKSYWNHGDRRVPNPPTHKQLCPHNKRHMERLPETQAILKMFPWGRMEKDGSFQEDITMAKFDVLGGDGYGYWSQRGGLAPHAAAGVGPQAELSKFFKGGDFMDGNDLLKTEHLNDKEGWKLPLRLIPYLDFDHPASKRPVLVTELDERVGDWKSWHAWRRLPLESPAALLMAEPLSVYQLLVRSLQVTKPHAASLEKRKSLLVHLIGAETELNHIPLFAELALLLPYHDIKLVFFGGAVKSLVDAARKKPGSLASKDTIYSYTAPNACGSSTISIHLYGTDAFWTSDVFEGDDKPDAIVALNAGLGSYREWFPLVGAVHHLNIPFAVTEYAEQSVEHQIALFPQMLASLPASIRAPPRSEYPHALNPFQRPGQRAIGSLRMPNVSNGFTLTVVKL